MLSTENVEPTCILCVKKGVWLSDNSFKEDEGELIHIVPYKGFVKSYAISFPLSCYIHLRWNGSYYVIKDFVPSE